MFLYPYNIPLYLYTLIPFTASYPKKEKCQGQTGIICTGCTKQKMFHFPVHVSFQYFRGNHDTRPELRDGVLTLSWGKWDDIPPGVSLTCVLCSPTRIFQVDSGLGHLLTATGAPWRTALQDGELIGLGQ